jgi:hypothetical protein
MQGKSRGYTASHITPLVSLISINVKNIVRMQQAS